MFFGLNFGIDQSGFLYTVGFFGYVFSSEVPGLSHETLQQERAGNLNAIRISDHPTSGCWFKLESELLNDDKSRTTARP